jgi:diketogulonate reductase-like aldo/keto reductase
VESRRTIGSSAGDIQVDIFLLHSPSAADLAEGEALDCLSALKQEGLARCIGVSCDDQATLAIIASDNVEARSLVLGWLGSSGFLQGSI